jgi:hypothetical protein
VSSAFSVYVIKPESKLIEEIQTSTMIEFMEKRDETGGEEEEENNYLKVNTIVDCKSHEIRMDGAVRIAGISKKRLLIISNTGKM